MTPACSSCGCTLEFTVGRELAMLTITRTVVDSSSVQSYGYDARTRTIQVFFHGGDVYEYYNRTPITWQNFQKAASKGQFVHEVLTPAGNYKQVR